MKKAVFFDMDGLMFDTEKLYFLSRKEIFNKYNIEFTVEDYLPYSGKSEEDSIQRIYKRAGSKELGETIWNESSKLFEEMIQQEGSPEFKEGLIDFLNYLKNNEIKAFVVSSSTKSQIKYLVEKFELESYFENYIGGDDVELAKPNPEIYVKAKNISGFNEDEIIVLEDSKAGVEAANSAGIDVIMIPDLTPPTSDIVNLTFEIADSFKEINLDIFN